MSESAQHYIGRNRAPMVHLTYEVETEGAMEKRDIPFTVGVLADLVGNAPGAKPKPFKERSFTNIDRDNFNDVMKKLEPGIRFRAPNTLEEDGQDIVVNFAPKTMADFEPGNVVKQVEPLQNLMEIRNKLRDILVQADHSGDFEELLEDILQDPAKFAQLKEEVESGGKSEN